MSFKYWMGIHISNELKDEIFVSNVELCDHQISSDLKVRYTQMPSVFNRFETSNYIGLVFLELKANNLAYVTIDQRSLIKVDNDDLLENLIFEKRIGYVSKADDSFEGGLKPSELEDIVYSDLSFVKKLASRSHKRSVIEMYDPSFRKLAYFAETLYKSLNSYLQALKSLELHTPPRHNLELTKSQKASIELRLLSKPVPTIPFRHVLEIQKSLSMLKKSLTELSNDWLKREIINKEHH